MRQRGSISSLLTSKMGLMIAVMFLIISTTAFSSRIRKETEKEKLESVIEKISDLLRKTEYLPGRVRIEEKLPQLDSNYKIVISGRKEAEQIVKIRALSSENFKRTIILNKTARKENFQIEKENPEKIILKKFKKFSLEVL